MKTKSKVSLDVLWQVAEAEAHRYNLTPALTIEEKYKLAVLLVEWTRLRDSVPDAVKNGSFDSLFLSIIRHHLIANKILGLETLEIHPSEQINFTDFKESLANYIARRISRESLIEDLRRHNRWQFDSLEQKHINRIVSDLS